MTNLQLLHEAREKRALVRIYRSNIERGWITGWVDAVGLFVVVRVLDDGVRQNGFICVRVNDVTDFRLPDPEAGFLERVLTARHVQLPDPLHINPDSAGSLISGAKKLFPVVTLHFETFRDTVCYVGEPVAITEDQVQLKEISTNGQWDDDIQWYNLAAVSRVDFGGAYEEALHLSATFIEPPG